MEHKKLKLPVGIQRFERIRKGGFIYVDKTKYLVKMIRSGDIYFLARPRRFGKSVIVSTFEAIFAGEKELFKGLYAEEFMKDFEPSPIIRLDMSKVTTHRGIDELEASICHQVKKIANRLKISLSDTQSSGDLFDDLISTSVEKYNQQVVILIDEYDSPYVEFVNDTTLANNVRNVLRGFYKQLKANEEYIRFIFITGISKFAKVGVFSSLNNLKDISLMPEYSEICGLTEEEIIKYFPDYLAETAQKINLSNEGLIEKMRSYYNGFSFDYDAITRLYNPFSTLEFFDNKRFLNYWIDTGKPKIIADYLKHRNLTVEQFRNYPISEDFAKSPGDVDETPPEGFLYQAGYLTLRPGTTDYLSLDYPNTEVLNSMSALVSHNFLQDKDEDYTYCRSDLLKALMNANYKMVVTVFNRLLASIVYDDFRKVATKSVSDNDYDMDPREWHYRSILFAFLRGCGVVVFAEMHTNLGRSDIVLLHKGHIWVLELKVAYEGYDPAKKAEEAYIQIVEKNYAKPYPNALCMGLAIDDTKRMITHYTLPSSKEVGFETKNINQETE
ncbi:MAG: ATP-binding protein [Marinilabiliaceae bacterium]|nr:ATP-binding protein [Marinilabiliaceae bacterium]